MEKNTDIDARQITGWLKANAHLIILLLVLIYGAKLRIYHLDYPVIGYHNTKEAHTLSEAKNFYRGWNILIPKQDSLGLGDTTYGVHGDNFPLLAWIITAAWKVLGMKLWVARGIMVAFSLSATLMTYLIMKKLFRREDIALISSFFFSVNPLSVFFGRQVQYEIPAVFFGLLSIYFYLEWRETPKLKWVLLSAACTALTAMLKYPFAIAAFPIIMTFPLERLQNYKKYIWHYITTLLFVIPIVWWWFLSRSFNPLAAVDLTGNSLAKMGRIITTDWWGRVLGFATSETFTTASLLLAVFGLAVVMLHIKKFRYRFLMLWFLALVPYSILMADFLYNHNYYQAPFVPILSCLEAVGIVFLVSFIPKIKSIPIPDVLRWLAFAALYFMVLHAPLMEHINRQFDTQFYGLDVAGDFINQNSLPNERILESGHQDKGILWHADRGIVKGVGSVKDMAFAENNFSVRWLFIYNWAMGFPEGRIDSPVFFDNPELTSYIKGKYTLRQFGFVPTQNGIQPMYFVLEKGGSFDGNLLKSIDPETVDIKNYELTSGKVALYYKNFGG